MSIHKTTKTSYCIKLNQQFKLMNINNEYENQDPKFRKIITCL